MLSVGEQLNIRKGQKTITLSDGTRGTIRNGLGEAPLVLRVYHWSYDANYERELLLENGVKLEQIRHNLVSTVSLVDPTTRTISQVVKAIPEAEGGSGKLYVLEIDGLSREQLATICAAEAFAEESVLTPIEYTLFGQREIKRVVMDLLRCDAAHLTADDIKDRLADSNAVKPEDITLVGEWAENERREQVSH